MKKSLLTFAALLMTSVTALSAGPHRHRFEDTAKVIDVEPLYQTIEVNHPERYCWEEDVSYYEPEQHSYTGTVLGGIVGGVMANHLYQGQGKGRDVATLAGALLGGAIGHDLSHAQQHGHLTSHTERHCEVENHTTYEERLVGYRVKYRYEGQTYYTRTEAHPGKHIQVRVKVSPVNGT